MIPKLAAYVSSFNVLQNGISYREPLERMLAFFDLTVVAVNTSTDSTLAALQSMASEIQNVGRLYIIETSFAYIDVTFDGATKNAALQEAYRLTGEAPEWVYVQMDLDEMPVPNQRIMWRGLAAQLLALPEADCLMFPTVDVWGSMDTIRDEVPLGLKQRIHKRDIHRGVWKDAWIIPGKRFRTDMSDSGEALRSDGSLAHCAHVVPHQYLHPSTHHMLNGYPYTVHLGYLSFDQRVRVNKAIWADHWTLRNNGQPMDVVLDTAPLRDYPVVKHCLNLT